MIRQLDNPYYRRNRLSTRGGFVDPSPAASDIVPVGEGLAPIGLSEAREEVFRQTAGRGDQVMSNPNIRAALDAFNNVVGGSSLPYDDAFINRAYGTAADMNAAANSAQNAALARQMGASGGSVYDPAYQAATRSNMAQRQQANQGAMRDLLMQQQTGNFAAQQDAASRLASTQLAQYGTALPQYNQAANYASNITEDIGSGVGTQSIPSVQYRAPTTERAPTSYGPRPAQPQQSEKPEVTYGSLSPVARRIPTKTARNNIGKTYSARRIY